MDAEPARPRYFVLVADPAAGRVLALTGHDHDFVGAVLTLTRRLQEHRDRPQVVVRLLAAASVPDLVARHPDLFDGLRLEDDPAGQA